MSELWRRTVTRDESRDTGMAMVLLLLILFASTRRNGLLLSAVVVHVINMIVPQIFRPAAVVWLSLSHLIGKVASSVLLFIVFFAVVTPIGVLRRMFGYDSLKLRAFRASDESVMVQRNHTFVARDLDKPY